MKIYVVMEKVDLGGSVVCAHECGWTANQKVEKLQKEYVAERCTALMKNPYYTSERAQTWCDQNCSGQYYIEEVELLD